jgi:mannose-6-phosphate isomerase-like protein (cupin superfamily)
MKIVSKGDIEKPIEAPLGELIYELVGSSEEAGRSSKHSLAYVVIPKGDSSPTHKHKVSEETYYILKGKARMIIDSYKFTLLPGQACLIMPGEVHQIFNYEEEDLEFLAISAPAWTPEDSFEIEPDR